MQTFAGVFENMQTAHKMKTDLCKDVIDKSYAYMKLPKFNQINEMQQVCSETLR